MQRNPTCNIETYMGGLECCLNQGFLLDTNQPQPWPNQNLTYKMRVRFWYQEYTEGTAFVPSSHTNLVRFYWQTESFAGEYDVPKGSLNLPGTSTGPDGGYRYTIESFFRTQDMVWNCDPSKDAQQCTQGTKVPHRWQWEYMTTNPTTNPLRALDPNPNPKPIRRG